MINLAQQKPDFTGTWFQGKESGDFKIYILDIQANQFFGVKIDSNGIAEIEGQINLDGVYFLKVYARYVTEVTNASKIPLEYFFEENIFEAEVGNEISGIWSFPCSYQGGVCKIKIEQDLKEFLPRQIIPIGEDIFNYFSGKKTIILNSGSTDDLPF